MALRRRLGPPVPKLGYIAQLTDACANAIVALLGAVPTASRPHVLALVRQRLEAQHAGSLVVEEADVVNEAGVAVELLSQAKKFRLATASWTPRRLQRLYDCFHRWVLKFLEGLVGQVFDTQAQADAAVAAVVRKAVAEVASDPAGWARKHCKPTKPK